MGLSEEGTTADGVESGCAGAGGVEKGGLLSALRRGEEVVFADEMRLGLLRQVRRGEKMRQRVELRYEWVYLVLGVDPMKGRLWWDWVKRVRGVEIAQVLRTWKGAGAWYGTMRPLTRRRWWERWGCGGCINRPTLLSSILRNGYLRRFGGG
jgi:hypothetical protein